MVVYFKRVEERGERWKKVGDNKIWLLRLLREREEREREVQEKNRRYNV